MIGKTNVPELTQWPFTESMTYGITRNPWDPERTPGGPAGAVRRRWRPGWSARRSGPTAVARSGSQRGLPLAVQLVGRPWEESTLLSLAAQLEAARPWADRRPPIA